MSVHQSGCAPNSASVRSADDLLPLRCRKLISRQHMANLVVQNLSGCARQSAEAVVMQHRKIVSEWHAREFHAINNFHRREGMNVHSWNSSLHRVENVAIIERRQAAREAALNANFRCTELPSLHCL